MHRWFGFSPLLRSASSSHRFLPFHGDRLPGATPGVRATADETGREKFENTTNVASASRSCMAIGFKHLLCSVKPMQAGGIRPGG